MRRRPGLSLFELIVALFVLTTAMTAIVQLLAVAATQRRTIEQRRVALLEVANQAERIALLPWSTFEAEATTVWDLSENARKVLGRAKCEMQVTQEMGAPRGRQIQLIVRSPNAAGQVVELADLTVWKFAPGGEP